MFSALFKPSVLTSVANYEVFIEGQYCSLSARVLFLWDYCVTFRDEVNYVWGRRISIATVLFMLNRYVNLLITIMELLEQSSIQNAQSCGPFIRVLQALLVFAMVIAGLFAALRVYAIWGCNWRPALVVLLLSLISPVGNAIMYKNQETLVAPPPSVGCAVQNRLPPQMFSQLIIANRASVTAYEGVALLFTIARTLRIKQDASRLNIVTRLVDLLLRDGTTYFVALTVLNIAQIIVTSQVSGNNYLSFYVAPLTSVLISRFLLDIRQLAPGDARPSDPYGELSSQLDTLHFAVPSYVSSLAGELGRGSPALTMVDYDLDDEENDKESDGGTLTQGGGEEDADRSVQAVNHVA